MKESNYILISDLLRLRIAIDVLKLVDGEAIEKARRLLYNRMLFLESRLETYADEKAPAHDKG